MDFDINKFARNIQQHNVKNKKIDEQRGMVNVINHYMNHDEVLDIDFNSFSIKDVLLAFKAMECLPIHYEDDEYFIADPNNPFMLFKQIDSAIYKLAISKDKLYEKEKDEEFFI